MKLLFLVFSIGILIPFLGFSQYTDVINSNRPGASASAFAVGKNVIQGELGIGYEKQEHTGLQAESSILHTDFTIRYGLLFEQLEITWKGNYLFNNTNRFNAETKTNGLLSHTIGAKYLFFDPFKNPENNKPNLYSWKANNGFKWKDLIPAISIYAGVNLNLLDTPYAYNNIYSDYLGNFEEPTISPKVMLATQSHIAGRWVVVTNLIYDKIATDFPEYSYIITVTHALNNPKWTVFAENQGIKSDMYADLLVRGGTAYLLNKNTQFDISLGTNFKDTPSRIFGSIGISYRIDNHTDEIKAIDNGKQQKQLKKEQRQQKKKNKKNEFDILDDGL